MSHIIRVTKKALAEREHGLERLELQFRNSVLVDAGFPHLSTNPMLPEVEVVPWSVEIEFELRNQKKRNIKETIEFFDQKNWGKWKLYFLIDWSVYQDRDCLSSQSHCHRRSQIKVSQINLQHAYLVRTLAMGYVPRCWRIAKSHLGRLVWPRFWWP